MNNIDVFALLPVAIVGFILLISLLIILRRIFVNVGAREIAIKERRYLGRRMPPGRVVATEGEVGIQAEVLKPGLHLIKFPFERVVRKVPLIEIGADELGPRRTRCCAYRDAEGDWRKRRAHHSGCDGHRRLGRWRGRHWNTVAVKSVPRPLESTGGQW